MTRCHERCPCRPRPSLGLSGACAARGPRPRASPGLYWIEVGGRLDRRDRQALGRWLEGGFDAPLVRVPDRFIGFDANGWQYLAVYPAWEQHGMWRFFELVERLVPGGKGGVL